MTRAATSLRNALYFSVVFIETIGNSALHCRWYHDLIMIIALTVVVARDAILESAVAAFRQRVLVRQHERRLRSRWLAAVSWCLRTRVWHCDV